MADQINSLEELKGAVTENIGGNPIIPTAAGVKQQR